MKTDNYLASLIKKRIGILGIKEHELVKRLGYKNLGKGLNRLQKLYAGEFDPAGHILNHLPHAIETEKTLVDEAYQKTLERARSQKIRQAQLNFKLHALYLTEHRVPTQITLAGISGAVQQRYVYFEPNDDPQNYKEIALARRPEKISSLGL